MAHSMRCIFSVFFASLIFATGSYADSFRLTYSGPDISGSALLIATPNGNGVFTATSITGSQVVGGVTETITGLIAPTTTFPPASFYPLPNGGGPVIGFIYDDLLYFPANPTFLDGNGLLFTATNLAYPMNLVGSLEIQWVPTAACIVRPPPAVLSGIPSHRKQ